MNKPVSLIDREIETKIDAALKAEIAKGKKPSDMGVRDFHGIADSLRDKVSPAAHDELVRQGLEHMVKFVLGAMIAEVVWNDRTGWPATDAAVLSATRRVSPYFTAMREAGSDAAALEAELGISPRRRGSVQKVERKQRRERASDGYLGKANG